MAIQLHVCRSSYPLFNQDSDESHSFVVCHFYYVWCCGIFFDIYRITRCIFTELDVTGIALFAFRAAKARAALLAAM